MYGLSPIEEDDLDLRIGPDWIIAEERIRIAGKDRGKSNLSKMMVTRGESMEAREHPTDRDSQQYQAELRGGFRKRWIKFQRRRSTEIPFSSFYLLISVGEVLG
jgi:hypothetical protein